MVENHMGIYFTAERNGIIMKMCKTCGAEVNDSAAFCGSCGARFEYDGGGAAQPGYTNVQPAGGMPVSGPPMTVGGWIGRSLLMELLNFVPLIGWIINIVLLCIWSGDNAKDQTFRNWAKAQIIVMLISIAVSVLLIVLAVMLLGVGGGYLVNTIIDPIYW